ncbi:MAG: aerial mycelium formation protein [Actinomycetota bacterium]
MSERVRIGGNRRIDRVLDPAFAEGLAGLSTDDLRARRDECRAEAEYLSYFRRLIQVRQDILSAERDRRATGDAGAIVDRLAEILAEPGSGSAGSGGSSRAGGSRGAYLSLDVPDEEIQLARRGAERLVSDASLSDLEAYTDQALTETIGRLAAAEQEVSEDRGAVFRVHDALQEELKARYKADLSQVPSEPR